MRNAQSYTQQLLLVLSLTFAPWAYAFACLHCDKLHFNAFENGASSERNGAICSTNCVLHTVYNVHVKVSVTDHNLISSRRIFGEICLRKASYLVCYRLYYCTYVYPFAFGSAVNQQKHIGFSPHSTLCTLFHF